MTTLFEMAASLARADAAMLMAGIPRELREQVLAKLSHTTAHAALLLPAGPLPHGPLEPERTWQFGEKPF